VAPCVVEADFDGVRLLQQLGEESQGHGQEGESMMNAAASQTGRRAMQDVDINERS
jgi:hypothetical protein